MSYTVIHSFSDLQDFNHVYKVGDKFPRLGITVKKSRIEELKSNKNKIGKPLITSDNKKSNFSDCMNPPEEKTEVTYTKTDINRMSTAELKALAKENGIDDSLNGGELKKLLIRHFGL